MLDGTHCALCPVGRTVHALASPAGAVGAAVWGSARVWRARYRRDLAVCYAGMLDIGGELVRRGWALAYRRYGRTYVR